MSIPIRRLVAGQPPRQQMIPPYVGPPALGQSDRDVLYSQLVAVHQRLDVLEQGQYQILRQVNTVIRKLEQAEGQNPQREAQQSTKNDTAREPVMNGNLEDLKNKENVKEEEVRAKVLNQSESAEVKASITTAPTEKRNLDKDKLADEADVALSKQKAADSHSVTQSSDASKLRVVPILTAVKTAVSSQTTQSLASAKLGYQKSTSLPQSSPPANPTTLLTSTASKTFTPPTSISLPKSAPPQNKTPLANSTSPSEPTSVHTIHSTWDISDDLRSFLNSRVKKEAGNGQACNSGTASSTELPSSMVTPSSAMTTSFTLPKKFNVNASFFHQISRWEQPVSYELEVTNAVGCEVRITLRRPSSNSPVVNVSANQIDILKPEKTCRSYRIRTSHTVQGTTTQRATGWKIFFGDNKKGEIFEDLVRTASKQGELIDLS
ncbi:MAG: hypothetical protein MMC33_002718 [Icmadophila ericetorum]|nr:hypothetical protein [Icmadophila ericetorum]